MVGRVVRRDRAGPKTVTFRFRPSCSPYGNAWAVSATYKRTMLSKLKCPASAAAALALVAAVPASSHEHGQNSQISHVLLISADGLHQSDLAWYVNKYPNSELAKLTNGGAAYSNARTPIPSDSFPGMVGQVTGGNPRTTGVYYDAEYNHNLLPAGTTSCTGQKTGAEVNYFEVIAKDPLRIDSGQGLSGLPDNILSLSGNPVQAGLIDPATLPVNPANCQPVYPHQYIKVNTMFEVARSHGLRTAWSDKHVAYEILNGPSGAGIQDLFAPEINSNALQPGTSNTPYAAGGDWTSNNLWTRQYDHYKVKAVLNEINGYDHGGNQPVGTPAIFGMNFQTISTAEKLPSVDGKSKSPAGGYLPGTHTPGPLLSDALNFLDGELASMDNAIQARGLSNSTAIILSAKHGQSPIDPLTLTRIDDGAIIDAVNAAWQKHHAGNVVAADPGNQAAGSRDDAFPLWLTDRSQKAANFVRNYLWNHPADGNTYDPNNPTGKGPTRTLQHSGLKAVYAGDSAADYWGVSRRDARHPDVWGVVQHGVVYTGKTKKIAEHGGADFEDLNVPIIVYAPGTVQPRRSGQLVETTQIAPTILSLLGLNPSSLQAVQVEGTPVLPGIAKDGGGSQGGDSQGGDSQGGRVPVELRVEIRQAHASRD
jgi:hypothetical protein